jgi:hypothetical protein
LIRFYLLWWFIQNIKVQTICSTITFVIKHFICISSCVFIMTLLFEQTDRCFFTWYDTYLCYIQSFVHCFLLNPSFFNDSYRNYLNCRLCSQEINCSKI